MNAAPPDRRAFGRCRGGGAESGWPLLVGRGGYRGSGRGGAPRGRGAAAAPAAAVAAAGADEAAAAPKRKAEQAATGEPAAKVSQPDPDDLTPLPTEPTEEGEIIGE